LSGGLAFFLCSPVHWQVDYSADILICSQALLAAVCEQKNNADHKTQWMEAISMFCLFLSDILAMEEFQLAS
jgi:hypothetical protein